MQVGRGCGRGVCARSSRRACGPSTGEYQGRSLTDNQRGPGAQIRKLPTVRGAQVGRPPGQASCRAPVRGLPSTLGVGPPEPRAGWAENSRNPGRVMAATPERPPWLRKTPALSSPWDQNQSSCSNAAAELGKIS